ncbi:peroxisome biogenesis factor 10-like [Bacillus rossius redtenbacheri]|uniref:peroxisome biogenesis factor 10-like n=1 Tax=Bacillus rossius redtenbacheri TaxID=93214 RepID=UPI002FDD7D1B
MGHWRKDRRSRSTFRLLGLVTLAYGCGLVMQGFARWRSSNEGPPTTDLLTAGKGQAASSCPLCLEEVRETSCTPCGHMFCWSCIMEWLQDKRECPLCREALGPSRVVLLRNYLS